MNYQITSDNIAMSPSMEALAREKFKKIENRLGHIPENLKSARIVMNSAKDDQFLVKIHLVIKGKEYFDQEIGFSLDHALIESINLVERRLQTDKIISTEGDWKEARDAKRFDPQDAQLLEEEING